MIGGLRIRLLHDSMVDALRDGLEEQGWFNPNRTHRPVRLLSAPQRWDEPLEPNTLAVTTRAVDGRYIELGSNYLEDEIPVRIDLYAEGDSIGVDLTNDIRVILRGRIGTAVANGSLAILDFRQATPSPLGHVLVTDARVLRNALLNETNWMRHWFTVSCVLIDAYNPPSPIYPGPDLVPGPDLYPVP